MYNKVISVSRTKDVIQNSPNILSAILKGERECKLSFSAKKSLLKLDDIHTLVLWTKNPSNIINYKPLHDVLMDYVNNHNGLIALELTVTGWGGTFMEWNMPYYNDVYNTLKKIIQKKIIYPEAILLRYDPLLTIKLSNGIILSNMQPQLFKKIVKLSY